MKKQSTILPLILFIAAIGIAFSVNNSTHFIIYTNLKVINPLYLFGGFVIIIFTLLSTFLLRIGAADKVSKKEEAAIRIVYMQQDTSDTHTDEELLTNLETVA